MSDIIEKIREDRKFFFALFAFTVYSLFFAFKDHFPAELYGYASLGALGVYCGANIAQRVGLAWAEYLKLEGVKKQ